MKYDIEYICKIAERYSKEAEECWRNKNFIAAFVMYGSVLEVWFLAMCFAYPEEVRKTTTYKKVKKKEKRGFFLKFGLKDLIEIARELKWLPLDKQIEDIGIFEDWVRWVQKSRDLVHPQCWLKPDNYFGNIHEWVRKTPYRKYNKFVKLSAETIDVIRERLSNKVEYNIARRLRKSKPSRKLRD